MPAPTLIIRSRPSLQAVTALLESADLPISDLTEEHLKHFFFCGSLAAPQGLVGIELYGAHALLRSLVVKPSSRSTGLGSALVAYAESYARQREAQSVYLLTSTAQPFFERLGYRCVERREAPASIQSTPEFASICPASSAFMIKHL